LQTILTFFAPIYRNRHSVVTLIDYL